VGNVAGLIFPLLLLLMLFMIISRSRRQQRQLVAVQASIEPGLRVMTTSGVHGTVISLGDDTVVLEIAPGVHTTWARPAIAEIRPDPPDQVPDDEAPDHQAPHDPVMNDDPVKNDIDLTHQNENDEAEHDRDDRTLT
jgi:preprotein translocase subunit YajC